jgi:excisionase family DNA binding protein
MINEKPTEKKLITTKRAAELMGISVLTVQKYCDSGLIKMYKSIGGHRRIPMESLNEYMLSIEYKSKNKYRGEFKLEAMLFENDPHSINEFESYCFKSDLKIRCIKLPSVFEMMIEILNVRPKLILVSLDLPEFDGFQFAKFIERYSRLKNTMVILTSNKYHDFSDYAASSNGRVAFVQKPIPDGWLDGYFCALKIQHYLSSCSDDK